MGNTEWPRTGLTLMRQSSALLLEAYEVMMDTGELFSLQHEALVDEIEDRVDTLLYLLGRDKRNQDA